MEVNLEKSKQVVVDLIKDTPVENVKARVVLAIDCSGSMASLYSNGTVQRVLERVMPLAMTFDDNNSLEVYKFDNGSYPISTKATPSNYKNYVDKYVHTGSMGGTEYKPVMVDIVNGGQKSGGLGGFIKSLFTKAKPENTVPTYVIFITDGGCSDSSATMQYIKQVANKDIFWQFVGIGSSQFRTLGQLDTMQGRVIDNTNFFSIRNTKDLVDLTDRVLMSKLLAEFPSWYKEAKEKEIIK